MRSALIKPQCSMFLTIAAVLAFSGANILSAGKAFGEEGGEPEWKTEFTAVCATTQEAHALSENDLTLLLGRCEKLRPQVEKLEESERKVVLKRLKMCCDFYRFMLESKRAAP